ncbi:MAG: type I-U CRISPR-associated helicase/endonuclease Cas3 [Minicystis sp.]
MVDLSPEHFAAYFEAVHGSAPFPWQARLLTEVARSGAWPDLLDLPTGAGKTAAIDVALFHLALDAGRPAAERRAPRRIVMVVDRRTVVDQAFARAAKIAQKLGEAREGVLQVVADRLRSLSGTDAADAPVALAQLRGGMPRDDAWARRPDQPVVAVSTVDQVGSRLLFRGYGVSDAMRPIHAGLLGNDTLVLLDEVHLSRPFRETLAALRGYRTWAGAALPDRWRVVEMSATPGKEAGPRFTLGDDDRKDARLARRLGAKKPAELHEVNVSGAEPARRAAFVDACAERTAGFAQPGRVVGVVVNRVATAREVFAAVRGRLRDRARVFLVTGRMRPLDRDDSRSSPGGARLLRARAGGDGTSSGGRLHAMHRGRRGLRLRRARDRVRLARRAPAAVRAAEPAG